MLAETDRQPSADIGDKKAVFESPLEESDLVGNDEDGRGSVFDAGEPVPPEMWKLLELGLGGPGSPSAARAWLWCLQLGSCLVFTGYGVPRAFGMIDPALEHGAIPYGVFCMISGPALGAMLHDRWQAYAVSDFCSSDQSALVQGRLRDLLRQDVLTADQVSHLKKLTKLIRLYLFITLVQCEVLVCAILYLSELWRVWDILVAYVGLIVTLPAGFLGLLAGVLLDLVASTVVVARVRPIINRCKNSTPAGADFDELLTSIVGVQHLVMAISTKLQRSIVLSVVGCAAAGFACIIYGLGPHPSDQDHWWRTYYISDLNLALGVMWALLSIFMLYQASRVTSVCDALGDAINEMTEQVKVPGKATLLMPKTDQQRSIEHLCGYVRGLNRGRGMGYVIYNKRISHSFVTTLAFKVVSVMTVAFPVILSLTRVEEAEDEILNQTEICAGL